MKYLITESQAKIAATFLKLDLKKFIQIKIDNNIYFVNSENDKYAQIRFNEDNGWCFIDIDLVKEISSFFSLQTSDSEEVIGKWVENTIQMKVRHTTLEFPYPSLSLRILSK